MRHSIIFQTLTCISLVTGNVPAYSDSLILPNKLDIVTSNSKPLRNTQYAETVLVKAGAKLNVYNLDSISAFKSKLNKKFKLPPDEHKAKVIIYEYINKMGQEAFNKQVISVYQGLLTTFKYKIDRYPAIIFDESSVIYGVTDLKQALIKYHQWQYDRLNRKGYRNE